MEHLKPKIAKKKSNKNYWTFLIDLDLVVLFFIVLILIVFF